MFTLFSPRAHILYQLFPIVDVTTVVLLCCYYNENKLKALKKKSFNLKSVVETKLDINKYNEQFYKELRLDVSPQNVDFKAHVVNKYQS